MGTEFNWHTEEEDWADNPPPAAGRKSSLWRRLSPFFFLVVILGAVLLVFRQVNRQVDSVAQDIEADLFASVEIMQRAQQRGDLELFRSVLSGRDQVWTQAQRELFDRGLLFDRPALGLHLATLPAPNRDTLDLSSDLNSATLVTTLDYLVRDSDGLTHTIQLTQTQVFRTGSNRWLYAPPPADFWGGWHNASFDRLQITYPARDETIALRLGRDIDQLLTGLCSELPELDCGDARPLQLRFGKDPAILAAIEGLENHFAGSPDELQLPTPGLVGYPVDDAAYQALFRGYARHAALVAVAGWSGYECCGHGLELLALVDYLVATQGAGFWPATPDLFDGLLAQNTSLHQAGFAWFANLPDAAISNFQAAAYAGIAYLLERGSATSPGKLLLALNTAESFSEWLFAAGAGDAFAQEQAWDVFVFSQSSFNQQPQPAAWPNEDVLLGCHDSGGRLQILRYRPDTAQLTSVVNTGLTGIGTPLPGHDGFLITLNPNQEALEYHIVWADGSQTTVFPEPRLSPHMFLEGTFDTGSDRLVWTHSVRNGFGQINSFLDLDACRDQESCRTIAADGLPVWSPDGQQTLLLQTGRIGPALWLGDGSGAAIGLIDAGGTAPFWLNNNYFGYINDQGINLWQRPTSDSPYLNKERITRLELTAALGLDRRGEVLLDFVGADPVQENTMIVMAFDLFQSRRYLVRLDLSSGEATIVYEGRGVWFGRSVQLHDQFFYFTMPRPENSSEIINVVDLGGAFSRQYPAGSTYPTAKSGIDWSATFDWLVIVPDAHHLLFAVPSLGYQNVHLLDLDASQSCHNAIWVAREE